MQGLGMNVPRFASTPVCGRSVPDGPVDMWPSGNNPFWLNRSAMPYGRNLRGLGLVPDNSFHKDTWSGDDAAVQQAAQADDVAGNGIFDGPGAPPTAYAGTGVFASDYALPGYLYRERPTEPSEIRDTTTGLPVVYQPGPANWFADMRETYRPFDLEVPRYYSQNAPGLSLRGLGEDPGSGWGDKAKAYAPWFMLGGGLALALMVALRLLSSRQHVGGAWEYDEGY
jgi:hypothetical protein